MGQRSVRGNRPGAVGPQVAADGVDVAAVAQLLDLPGERGSVGADLHPPVMQIEPVVVDHARAVGCRDEKLLDIGGPREAQDGAAAEAELPGDGPQAVATFDAFVDLLVAFAGAGDQRPLPTVHVQFAYGGGTDARWWAGAVLVGPHGEGFSQVGAVSSDDSLDGLGEVVQQVPGIGHLPGMWCTGVGTVAEGAGAVAADNSNLGVFAQPGGEGVRSAVREDIDRAAGVHVDEDRRVGTTAAHGELVNAQIGDRLRRRDGQREKESEQGVLSGGDGHASAQTGAGTSAQEHGNVRELAGQGIRAACVPTCQVRDLLGERPTPAAAIAAHETTPGPAVPADQQRDGLPDTAGSSSAHARISIHTPDKRPTPPWTARQDGPQRPQEQPLLPRLRLPEKGGQRGEPHPHAEVMPTPP